MSGSAVTQGDTDHTARWNTIVNNISRQSDDILAEIRALRSELADLRASLEPKVGTILVGIEVDREFRRRLHGAPR